MYYLLMVSFPKGKLPAETFVDPTTFSHIEKATNEATNLIMEHNAEKVTIYALSLDGRISKTLILTGDID